MADVQGDDLGRSPAQQHIAESSGGGADVEASEIPCGDQSFGCEGVEGAYQFVGASGNVVLTQVGGHGVIGGDLQRRLARGEAIHADLAVRDQTLRLRPAVDKTAIDQGDVQTDRVVGDAAGHGNVPHQSRWNSGTSTLCTSRP